MDEHTAHPRHKGRDHNRGGRSMNRFMKTMLALVVAAFGFGAMAAGASASIVGGGGVGVPWTTSSVSGTNHVFTATNPDTSGTVVVHCTGTQFNNIHGAGDHDASFEPDYSGCTADVAFQTCDTVVDTHDGTWTLTQGAELLPPGSERWTGSAALGQPVTITVDDHNCGIYPGSATECTLTVPAQPNLTGTTVVATNKDADTVNLTGTVEDIGWETSTSGCGLGIHSSTPVTNATYDINSAGGGIDIGDASGPVQLTNP